MTQDEIDSIIENPGPPGIYLFSQSNFHEVPITKKWDGIHWYMGYFYEPGTGYITGLQSSLKVQLIDNEKWVGRYLKDGRKMSYCCDLDGNESIPGPASPIQLDLFQ